ncbi:MAG: AbrB family transcriptional regulator [Synergistaceae bacterium]|nr:AbrB family transcriptional regulator [Synergistaceae bacterium]
MTVLSFFSPYLLLLLVGLAGFLVFKKLSVPVPALLGPLFFAGMLNLIGLYPEADMLWPSRCSNVIIGALAGSRVSRRSARLLGELPLPALVVSAGMLALSLCGGALLYLSTDLSPRTAFIGSTTGGISEMALLSISMGADVATVTLLQTARVLIALTLSPMICRALPAILGRDNAGQEEPGPGEPEVRHRTASGYALLAAAAVSGGFAGYMLRLPAGVMTGAMIGTAAANLLREGLPSVPRVLVSTAQAIIGLTIASNISASTFGGLGRQWLPVSVVLMLMLLGSIAIAELLHRMTGWNYPTCLLSASLGGLSQMIVIADEMGADPLKVTLLQTVRLLSIIIVLPLVFSLFFL